ncbi:hypothetical protein S144_13 [Shewanella sp. phage 1/44]|nr:hypothetical protein S144_13 [Shewanella sp. phage 1/44]AHK11728.1 hypothetical protein S144_13 [Shewanella sp. phage 1/44]
MGFIIALIALCLAPNALTLAIVVIIGSRFIK